ncbi:Duodenase-1 [Orchesella cincta]|uniref:Duodenase-1 n=1 Tax=Orchesella cincta TaxID=48709 RepID=A0A1D2MK13_ORCCI|nr:Duodenase-1 [Orchesella cincta]
MKIHSKIVALGIICIASLAVTAKLPVFHSETLVVGGTNATKNEFPFLVRFTVLTASGESRFCSGTLIDLDLVLSSATCAVGNSRPITVVAGDHLLLEDEGTEQSVASQEVILHEDFNTTGNLENDIALIRLTSKLENTTSVQVINLPPEDLEPKYASHGTVAGWGETKFSEEEGQMSPILLKTDVIIADRLVCAAIGGTWVPEGQICSVSTGGGYRGDLGGPLICSNAPDAVCGIISNSNSGALTTVVGGYVEVSQYLAWIDGYRNTA